MFSLACSRVAGVMALLLAYPITVSSFLESLCSTYSSDVYSLTSILVHGAALYRLRTFLKGVCMFHKLVKMFSKAERASSMISNTFMTDHGTLARSAFSA